MDQHDHFFTPEHVDEQIDQSISAGRAMPDDQFLAEMQQVARQIRAEQERSLRRVESRLLQHALARPEKRTLARKDEPRRSSAQRIVQQGSIYSMEKQKEQKKSRMSSIGRRISLLAAVLVMAVLVGSLVLVMRAARPNTAQRLNNTQVGAARTATSTPQTPASTFGKTAYTTPSSMNSFAELAWSPDSTRVAALTDAQNNPVTIWDATTGKHSVTVSFPSGVGEFPLSLSWSPNSQLVAIGTTTGVVIANGQTGAIVKNYPISMVIVDRSPATSSGSYLSAQMPDSGGVGVEQLAWSPDGSALALSIGEGPGGKVMVLNAQSGAVKYTLPLKSGYAPDTLAWSLDGKYLAANVHNTSGTAPVDQMVMTWVWNTATKQIVFQHTSMNTNDSLAWSPNNDVLAFDGQENTIVLTVWNAATNQLSSYQANVAGPLAWSPDGKYLVFAGTTTNQPVDPLMKPISVIDATSGKLVYEYKQMDQQVATLSWSPDGKYIVSGAGDFAKVWSAE